MKCYIENYGDTAFNCVVGGTYKDNLNESLDSFSIVITQLTTKLELEPIKQHIRIDFSDTILENADEINTLFVIDNYTETFFNKNNTIYYEYNINLCSQTKILEFIQLPNRVILHSLIDGHKKLYQVIQEMCELYLPKAKKTTDGLTWTYDYIFNLPDLSQDSKFDIDCPDLSFNEPSLREVLNTLYSVVGCIPFVREYEFGYIDLRLTPTPFTTPTGETIKKIRSLSSDSFATTLKNPLSRVLDENQVVRNETIGFRDDNNVFLKHSENLVLTTDYPIESVKELSVNAYKYATIPFANENVGYCEWVKVGDSKFTNRVILHLTDLNVIESIEFYFAGIDQNKTNDANKTQCYSYPVKFISLISYPSFDRYGTFCTCDFTTPDSFSFIVIRYIRTIGGIQTHCVSSSLFDYTGGGLIIERFFGAYKVDLTPMVLEHQERLATDKGTVPSDIPVPIFGTNTIDFTPLRSSYYETLEYTYQSNEIIGFSNTWEWLSIFLDLKANLLDQITKWVVVDAYSFSLTPTEKAEVLSEVLQAFKLNEITDSYTVPIVNETGVRMNALPTSFFGGLVPYTQYTFDIRYVPFNDLVASHTKEISDIPIEYTKVDKQEASIIMFDDFSEREQEKINRIGNPIAKMVQPQVKDFANINPLNSISDGDIVFTREIAFFSSFCEVNYTATKNYVLKNYFTALQNKYRAYEYSSANSALERNELIKTFVEVSFGNIEIRNGTDKIASNDWTFLCAGLAISDDYKLTYTIIGKYGASNIKTESYKYDVSVITGKKSIFVSHKEKYASLFGNYIFDPKDYTGNVNPALGGYIQSWYQHGNNYNEKHRLGFTNRTFVSTEMVGYNDIIASLSYPKVDLQYQNYALNFVFYVKDSSDQYPNKAYYKSEGEKLAETVQFEYYASDDIVSFGENLLEYTTLKRKSDEMGWLDLVIIDNETAKLEIIDGERDLGANETLHIAENAPTYTNYVGGCKFNLRSTYIYRDMKLAYRHSITHKIYDLVRIVRPTGMLGNDIILNFSVNDTKSQKVFKYNETSGIYEPIKNVAKANNDREIEN